MQQEVSVAQCMEDVYNQLAARVEVEAEASLADHRIIVGIVGVPGSGKSTTAEAVCHLLNERLPGPQSQAVVVSMDGALSLIANCPLSVQSLTDVFNLSSLYSYSHAQYLHQHGQI